MTTPSIAGSVAKPTAGWDVNGSYLVDVVSHAARSVDIVSTASRSWRETRQAGALEATYKPGIVGLTARRERLRASPTTSAYAGGVLGSARSPLEKNVTLFAGYDHGHDVARGRTGTPF